MANSSKKKSSSGLVVNVVVLLALIATLERAVFDAWGNQWTILSGDALNFFFITLCYIGLVFENRSIQWTFVVWALAWFIYNIVLISYFQGGKTMSSGLVDFKQGTVSYWETSNQPMNPNTIEIIHAAVQLAMTALLVVMIGIFSGRQAGQDDFDGVEGDGTGYEMYSTNPIARPSGSQPHPDTSV